MQSLQTSLFSRNPEPDEDEYDLVPGALYSFEKPERPVFHPPLSPLQQERLDAQIAGQQRWRRQQRDPHRPRRELDVAAMVSYGSDLTWEERKVLDAFVATTQLYVDWFGDSRIYFSPWFGSDIWGIPETSVKRALLGLQEKRYIKTVGVGLTMRTARKNGRPTRMYDLIVRVHVSQQEANGPQGLDQVVWWNMNRGVGSSYDREVGAGYVRVGLWQAMLYMVERGEIRYQWRMSQATYRRTFGPIDARSRKGDLLGKLDRLSLVELYGGSHGPPGSYRADSERSSFDGGPPEITEESLRASHLRASRRMNLGNLGGGFFFSSISQEHRIRLCSENAHLDPREWSDEYLEHCCSPSMRKLARLRRNVEQASWRRELDDRQEENDLESLLWEQARI